ncbi:MAG: ABC transporter ATP-binding protein [Fulvivirga sp.]|nr:ABC transporter ATP-binding protein [Fulvivirga sp.]
MNIQLDNIAKRYNREVIFQEVNYTFDHGRKYAITGPNGSGKSTLLQIIAGYRRATKGTIRYNQGETKEDQVFRQVNIVAPYLELVEEFTLQESIDFHYAFKQPIIDKEEIINIAYLNDARNKPIKNFSSGMRQRLKLALAFFSDSDTLFLDEPTSNLDERAINWYKDLINDMSDKLIIIASNQPYEYDFCEKIVDLNNYK